jgi:peptidoglycan biosynthesis protein MviN/MurJ (putative lipid II flippase)
MIRATFGTWFSYGSTVLLQVMLADKLGMSIGATAFILLYAFAIAVASITTSTITSVGIPRLIADDGAIARRPAFLAAVLLGFVFLLTAIVAGDPAFAHFLVRSESKVRGIDGVIRWGSLFALTQGLAGGVGALCIAKGRRFLPAAAPVLPTLGGAIVLIVAARPSASGVMMGVTLGSTAQVCLLLVACRHIRLSSEHGDSAVGVSLLTVAQFVLLALLPPIELELASWHASSAGAAYNFAVRGLAVAQQLLIGGLLLSSIGDWSTLARTGGLRALRDRFPRALVIGGLALVLAAAVAFVAGRTLVSLTYQRGSFSAADAKEVAHILVFALPGFVAEGLSLIVAQAVLAMKWNDLAIGTGVTRACARLTSVVVGAAIWGPVGVAGGYSVASVLIVLAQVVVVMRRGLVDRHSSNDLGRALAVAGLTVAVAGGVLLTGTSAGFVRAAVVVIAFVTFTILIQPARARVNW